MLKLDISYSVYQSKRRYLLPENRVCFMKTIALICSLSVFSLLVSYLVCNNVITTSKDQSSTIIPIVSSSDEKLKIAKYLAQNSKDKLILPLPDKYKDFYNFDSYQVKRTNDGKNVEIIFFNKQGGYTILYQFIKDSDGKLVEIKVK
jgi:hypothetical protein